MGAGMRDFFIDALETIIAAMIVVGGIAILISGVAMMFSPEGGLFAGLAVWFGGAIWLMMTGGMAYLGLGIYHNTRRTAEAMEAMARR